MKKRIFKIIFILFLVFVVWLIIRFVIGGSEDTWICVDNEWVKHGVPSTPMPTKGCGQQLNLEENLPHNSETNLIKEEKLSEPKTPENILFSVPFISQAPFGQWQDPIYQNACEEASLIMAILWVRGVKSISKEEAIKEIKAITDFENKTYGPEIYSRSALDTAQLIKDYWDYNAEVRDNIGVRDILIELEKGNLVIVPVNGRKLNNPYYTPPGPLKHMLVIIGYDFITKEFITNDAGTRHGEKYRYKENVLENALQDYPTGYKEPINQINKVMIVIRQGQ